MHELTELIKNDMKPALGVTEPGAIAFAAAKARSYARGELVRLNVAMNSGMHLPVEFQIPSRWEMFLRLLWGMWQGTLKKGWRPWRM